MVNMYVLGLASSPPSGWTAVTTYNGRYVRFTTSTSQHGDRGGAFTHQHLSAATTSGDSSSVGGDLGGYSVLAVHNHSIPSVYSSYSNNDPSYYTYALWRIDLATWEASIRCFPADAVVLAKAPISCTGMSRFSNGDGRLVKLGSPGSTGGRNDHTDHSYTVTLESKLATVGRVMGGFEVKNASMEIEGRDHSHTATIDSVPSNTVLPKRVSMRFYHVTSETDRAPKDVVCFFDGTPTSNWTSLGYGDVFPICEDDSLTVSGSDEHGHAGDSATSSPYSGEGYCQSGTYSYAPSTHTHQVAVSLDSADHVPRYVSLCPYYLNTTLYAVVTHTKTYCQNTTFCAVVAHTKTWTMDHLLKAVKTASTTMSARAQSEYARIMTPDIVIRNTFTDGWDMDLIGKFNDLDETWDADVLSMIQPWSSWKMVVSLLLSHCSLESALRVVRPVTANPPVIDTIVKTFADELNYLQQTVAAMEWANRLPSATGSELDDKWGTIYEIPRWTGETDDAYKKRLSTYTLIHTSSGTKANAEAVLDSLVEEDGVSSVEPVWPASVRVNFATDTAMRMATTYHDLIEYTLSHIIAAGISWTLYLPYLDYEMGAKFGGQTEIDYDTDLLVKLLDKEIVYWLRPRFVSWKTETWNHDLMLLLSDLERAWAETMVLKTILDHKLYNDVLVQDTFSTSWNMSIRSLRAFSRTFSLGARVMSYDLDEAWSMDARTKRIIRRTYQALTTLILQPTAVADMDAWVKRFNVLEPYYHDLIIWVCEPEEYGMTIGMVPA